MVTVLPFRALRESGKIVASVLQFPLQQDLMRAARCTVHAWAGCRPMIESEVGLIITGGLKDNQVKVRLMEENQEHWRTELQRRLGYTCLI